jgi:hypothetical protein
MKAELCILYIVTIPHVLCGNAVLSFGHVICIEMNSEFNTFCVLKTHFSSSFIYKVRLCGVVVRLHGCKPGGPVFDSRSYQIF